MNTTSRISEIAEAFIMIDIETLGTNPNSPIIQFGAVYTGTAISDIDRNFISIDIDLMGQESGINSDTLKWWLGDSDRTEMLQSIILSPDVIMPKYAAEKIYYWLQDMPAVPILCKGASFDFPILKQFLLTHGAYEEAPWQFRHELDYRTIRTLYKSVLESYTDLKANNHSAVTDAINQAQELIYIGSTA